MTSRDEMQQGMDPCLYKHDFYSVSIDFMDVFQVLLQVTQYYVFYLTVCMHDMLSAEHAYACSGVLFKF